jgi:hypothetical protein
MLNAVVSTYTFLRNVKNLEHTQLFYLNINYKMDFDKMFNIGSIIDCINGGRFWVNITMYLELLLSLLI